MSVVLRNLKGTSDFLPQEQCVNAAAWCPAVDVANCPYVDGNGVHM